MTYILFLHQGHIASIALSPMETWSQINFKSMCYFPLGYYPFQALAIGVQGVLNSLHPEITPCQQLPDHLYRKLEAGPVFPAMVYISSPSYDYRPL